MSHWSLYQPTSRDLYEIGRQIDKAINYLNDFIRYQRSPYYTEAGADLRDLTNEACRIATTNFEHYWRDNNLDNPYSLRNHNEYVLIVAQKYDRMLDLIEVTQRNSR